MAKAKPCSNVGAHTAHPSGYHEHAEWAEAMMAKGYVQEKCPACGLWAIWRDPTVAQRTRAATTGEEQRRG